MSSPDQNRAFKFSFAANELKGLEAATLYMMAADTCRLAEQGKHSLADHRRQALFKREAEKKLSTKDPRFVQAYQRDLAAHMQCFRGPTQRLKLVLALVELGTMLPYAGWIEGSNESHEIEGRVRLEAMQALAEAALCQEPAYVASVVQKAIEDARDTHSGSLVGSLLFAAALAGLGFLVAGPVGGLLGGAFLGVSGAAAVSAGLAFLGGGAVAAGGFGMLGGTVVIASAFGVVGGAAANVFMTERGDVLARQSAIRTEAAVRSLCGLQLMDNELADDYEAALLFQRDHYRQQLLCRRDDKDLAKVYEVVERAFNKGSEYINGVRRSGLLLESPAAWSPDAVRVPEPESASVPASGLEFAQAFQELNSQHTRLRDCLLFLRKAHSRYAEVKNERWMRGLLEHLSGQTRERLMAGDRALSEAIDEVVSIALGAQSQIERLRDIADKVDRSLDQSRQLEELAERYRELNMKLQNTLRTERSARGKLAERCAELEARMALASLWWLVAENTNNALPALPGVTQGVAEASGAARWATPRDVQYALALQARVSRDELIARGADPARLHDIFEAITAIELALGEPLEEAKRSRTKKLAEVHPDRAATANHLVAEKHVIIRRHIEHGYELHELHAQMREEVAA